MSELTAEQIAELEENFNIVRDDENNIISLELKEFNLHG
jgi:hypothetical protein